MTDQELFKELVKKQVLDPNVANKVLKEADLSGTSAEKLLYEERLVNEVAVAKVKSVLLGAPYKDIDPALIPEDLLKVIPRETSQNYNVVPIERNKDMLVVGMLRPDDVRAAEALRFIAKQMRVTLGVYIITPSDLAAVWRRYAPYANEIEAAIKEIGSAVTREEGIVSLEEGAATAEDAPVIKIVATTLRQAVEINASDIHIEPQRKRLRIRFRVDGKLEEAASLPSSLSQPILSRVKVLAKLRLDETRIPQDGRFRTLISGRDIDFRVSTFPTPNGEKVALRVLDPTTGLKGLHELGLSDYNFKILSEGIMAPYGMVLLTGPTGSGKTTTLYAIMQKINSELINIVSLEDPVEYFMEGINQSQVQPEIGYDFSSGLRQILRQDPDVIMVGEIRDSETAGLAVNAALTGHMMLSTLHTNNALGVIPRLVDLGTPAFLLTSALNLMLAQRLVSRLCPNCRKAAPASAEAQKIISSILEGLPPAAKKDLNFKPPYAVYHTEPDPNCRICHGKGVAGRVAIFEIFRMTKELSDLIAGGFTENKLLEESRHQGMMTMREDGILKVLAGAVLLEEVLKETE